MKSHILNAIHRCRLSKFALLLKQISIYRIQWNKNTEPNNEVPFREIVVSITFFIWGKLTFHLSDRSVVVCTRKFDRFMRKLTLLLEYHKFSSTKFRFTFQSRTLTWIITVKTTFLVGGYCYIDRWFYRNLLGDNLHTQNRGSWRFVKEKIIQLYF